MSASRDSRRARGHEATARAPGPWARPPTSSASHGEPAAASGVSAAPGDVIAMSQPRVSRRRSRRRSPISGPPGRSTWQTASSLMPAALARLVAVLLGLRLGGGPLLGLLLQLAQRVEVVLGAGERLRVEVERRPEQAQRELGIVLLVERE